MAQIPPCLFAVAQAMGILALELLTLPSSINAIEALAIRVLHTLVFLALEAVTLPATIIAVCVIMDDSLMLLMYLALFAIGGYCVAIPYYITIRWIAQTRNK